MVVRLSQLFDQIRTGSPIERTASRVKKLNHSKPRDPRSNTFEKRPHSKKDNDSDESFDEGLLLETF